MSDKKKQTFLERGLSAHLKGWPVVILPYKNKRPLQKDWVKHKVTTQELKRYITQGKKYGIGIKGGNIVGLDDDYEESGAVTEDFLEGIAEIKAHFFPNTLKRKGRSTRPALEVFRLKGGETMRSMDVGKFQVIGVGRQFVAWNIHPDTNEPYTWRSSEGTPAIMPVEKVPAYSKDHLLNFLKAVELLEETWGLTPKNSRSTIERIKNGDLAPHEIKGDRATITAACEYLKNPEEWGWEEWNRNIMMALYGASGGEDWGLELAQKVSSTHPLYDEDETAKRWASLSRSPPVRIGAGTIYWQARQNGMPFVGPRDWDNYRAFLDREEMYNVLTDVWSKRMTFNDYFATEKEKGLSPVQTFMTSREHQCFDTVVWDPTLPYGEANVDGRSVWNQCQMPEDYGERGDVGQWIDLLENLYGEHTEIALQRMAFDIQYPQLKPQWHELIIGDHGIGKNLNKMPLHTFFGEMAASVNASVLEGQFQSFIVRRKHLELLELSSVGSKIFNRHKDLFATSDPWIEVNEKFRRPYRVRNILSVWLSTNEIDSISLSPTERRFFVVHKKGKVFSQERLGRIAEWIKKGGWRNVVYHLKNEVTVSSNFGATLPVRTEAFHELVGIAGRSHDKLRGMIRKATKNTLVFSLNELHQHLVEANVFERPGQIVLMETVRKALVSEGAIRCLNGQPVQVANGVRARLWSFETDAAGADTNEVRGLWLAGLGFSPVEQD